MKKIIFATTVLLACFTQIKAQDMNKRIFDEKSQTDILVGNCNREGILGTAFVNDYNTEYPTYTPVAAVMDSLKTRLDGIKCIVVLGTWCGDSKEQVSHFWKILDQLGSPFAELSYIGVDREKTAPGMNVKEKYTIEKVPTFIFYRNDVEIGRIIETPSISIEKDMLNIVKTK